MFESFQNLLPKTAGKLGFKQQFDAIQICQEFRNLTPKLLPPGAEKQTFPISYTKKTLTVGVYDPMWAQQVVMQKHRIIEEINKKYGLDTVKNIRTEVTEPREEIF